MFYLGSDLTHQSQNSHHWTSAIRKPIVPPLAPKHERKSHKASSKSIDMDRFDVIKFDDLTGPGGGDWVKIGGGSFGVVFRVSFRGRLRV